MAVPRSLTLEFSPAQIADLQRVLNPRQVEVALYQAVVRTTKRAKTIAAKAVLDRLSIPRKYVDDERNRYSAIRVGVHQTESGPEGKLTIREQQLPLSAFKYRSGKSGVRSQPDKSQPALLFRHAFVARVRSKRQEELGVSHTGIFARQRVSVANAQSYFDKNRLSFYRATQTKQITPAGYAWRLPLGELFGPSVLDFISRGEIRDAVVSQLGNELDKQLDSQVSRFTKGRYSSLDAAMAAITAVDTLADPGSNANA